MIPEALCLSFQASGSWVMVVIFSKKGRKWIFRSKALHNAQRDGILHSQCFGWMKSDFLEDLQCMLSSSFQ